MWEVCSANWWDIPKTVTPTASIGQQNGPSSSPWWCLTTTNHTTKDSTWMNWATKFCLICHIHLKVKLKVLARILEWEILPLSRGFAQSREETQVSLIARGFFMVWANREAFSPTDCHFFKHLNNFMQAKIFHKQQEAENTFQEFVKSQSMDLYITGMNKLLSHWQKFVDCNGSYFD